MAVNTNSTNIDIAPWEQMGKFDQWMQNLPTYDLRYGGQFGYMPIIGGVDKSGKPIHEWMYNQPYLRRDLIVIVLQTPRMFDLFPNASYWHGAIKALWEVHFKTIDGLNSSLTAEFAESEMGLSGASLEDVSNVEREKINLSASIDEKYGNPVEVLLDVWMRYGMMDPDTKDPLISRLDPNNKIGAYTPEWKTCTLLAIEPDVLNQRPIHAWLVSNVMPKANPEIIGKKDKKSSRELKNMTIDFTGFALPPTNARVMELASKILENLKLYTKTPNDILLPANDIASNLQDLPNSVYYSDQNVSAGTTQQQ